MPKCDTCGAPIENGQMLSCPYCDAALNVATPEPADAPTQPDAELIALLAQNTLESRLRERSANRANATVRRLAILAVAAWILGYGLRILRGPASAAVFLSYYRWAVAALALGLIAWSIWRVLSHARRDDPGDEGT